MDFDVLESDPQGPAALALLHEAALEAQSLYPEYHNPAAPSPTNSPTPPRGAYFVAFAAGRPVGMGAHRPVDGHTTEVRRMFVTRAARNLGVARAVLKVIEEHARSEGFRRLVLETGNRQFPAIRLYESSEFNLVPAFGSYANDPTSMCFAKDLQAPARSES